VTDDADADELDRRLARLFGEGRHREDLPEHPSPEKLSAYQANELPPEEEDAIQEHLVECSLCTELLLDLQRFLEPAEEERPGVADLAAEAEWRKVRKEMGWEGEKRQEAPAADVSRLRRSLRAFQAMAAVLLVGVLGLSVYALRLREEVGTSEALVSSSPLNVLGKRSGPEEDVETLEVSPGDVVVFTLHDLREASGEFRVEIHDTSGKTVWSLSGLRKRDNYLAFKVSSKVLKSGPYVIVAVSGSRSVGEYPVKIVISQ